MITKLFTALTLVLCFSIGYAQVGIGTATPNETSLLDMQSNSKGLLIPRMTTVERDAIVTPADGLQIYNTTKNTLDVYSAGAWKSFAYSESSNLVYVYDLADLPTPVGTAITLDATKMYVFSGAVNISPNYIVMNGAGLRGTDPQKDMVVSTVIGAVLRSLDTSVFIENLAVVPAGGSTSAYDFSDTTGTKYCNIFSGSSVVETPGVPSQGVGQVSGFKAITFTKTYWNATDGLKITGTVGKFTAAFCFMEGISNGAGLEFLADLTANDLDLSNNYFIYTGQTGIKVAPGATVDRARLTTNMFRGVTTPLIGIDSYSLGWSMRQNTNIPDSRAFSFIYFNNNTDPTNVGTIGVFYRIAGVTTPVNEKRFTTSNNKITYNGVEPIAGKIYVTISAKSPSNGSDYTIGIAKNGYMVPVIYASNAAAVNNQSFQITLNTEVDLVTGDFIEVGIRRNSGTSNSIVISELQFRVTD